ncbi:MAG: hypothetical protein PVH61_32940 [Candidatus Aminicenantes bacterium]|jgi:uncharacterized Zn finger protein
MKKIASMFQLITWDLLEEIAPNRIFLRGEDYYHSGAVSNITYQKQKDLITALVRGGQLYTVTIEDVSTDPVFICTCPYEAVNICKHGVAAALKIIYDPKSVEIKDTKDKKNIEEETATDLEALIKKATANQKENFLLGILKENSTYRNRFQVLLLGQLNAESETTVREIRDTVKEEIEDFNLRDYERFYEHYNPRDGWRDESEILYEGARDELEDIFSGYTDSIKNHLRTGNIVEAAKELVGLYEGIAMVDEDKIEDDIDIFYEGVVSELMYHFSYFMKEFVEHFQAADKNEDALLRISEIFVERLRYFQKDESDLFLEDYADEYATTTLFKPLLKELVCTTKTAKYWDSALEELNLKNNSTDEVQLKIAEVLEDKNIWLQVAEKNFESNPIVTQNLLDFYKQAKDDDNFIRVGRLALTTWGNQFDRYLYDNLDKEEDPDFFADILFHCAKREKSIPLFREYKELFGQKAAKAFSDQLKNEHGYKLFYIKLLEEEKDFPTILQYVKDNIRDWDFEHYIRPIITVYPDQCFEIISKKTNDFLENNTGRKYYTYAAQWLKLLLKIKDKKIKEKIQGYFNALFRIYNRRPALKDELKKVGIHPA